MDQLKKVKDLAVKYKYVVIVLGIGLLLMLLPVGQDREETPQETQQEVLDTTAEELEAILSQIRGVGKVEVMLTAEHGNITIYRCDEDGTVIVTDAHRAENGLVERVDAPQYRGAVVVCQGADSPVVKMTVVEAVSKVTGLGTDRISVLKMK